VPFDVNKLPLLPGEVKPVPPLAGIRVPARVTVPVEVTGPPEVVKPVVPPDTSMLVTVPVPGPEKATWIDPAPLVRVTPEPAVRVLLLL
jgi:hypothetical protein